MTGNCNTNTTTANKRGSYGDFRVWLNKQGIANLISLPMLEASGYIVSTHTHGQWVVTSPQGNKTTFKRDTGMCIGMPYIDLRDHQ